MSDRDLLDRIEDMDVDTVYFIRRADGDSWSAHVRERTNGALGYKVAEARSLRGAVTATVEPAPDATEWEDLI